MSYFEWFRDVGEKALPKPDDVKVIKIKVKGLCPACGQDTLELSMTNEIICRADKCPDRALLSDIISYGNIQHEHIADLKLNKFTLRHPLSERRDMEDLFDCPLHDYLSYCGTPPRPVGRYIVREVEKHLFPSQSEHWNWIKLGESQ